MWKPNKRRKKEFYETMCKIDEFCRKNRILQSKGSDTYYFTIGDASYVVGNRKRSVPQDAVFILASKTRIIEIYENLVQGKQLDYRGFVIA